MVSTLFNNDSFIGKYRIVDELASGAFGRVYRAEDTSLNNRIVAIKLMHSASLGSQQEHRSFLQEAEFLTMLNHPYILPVLDVGIAQDAPYMVTEFAPNGSLLDRLTKQAPRLIRLQEALLILAQIGSALHYAHQLNIIHRDLKPANILFNANGDAVLADFGIATMLAASIKYGTAIGTPYYMAPEQFRGSISKEGDQYALGCIAYEVLTGRIPFTAPDFFALGYKHMMERPIAPTQLNLLLSRTTEQAILKAMAKQRSDRFPDVAAFLTALGAPLATGVPQSRPLLPAPPPVPLLQPYTRSTVTSVNIEQTRNNDPAIMHNFQRNEPVSHPPAENQSVPPIPLTPPLAQSQNREATGHIPVVTRQQVSPPPILPTREKQQEVAGQPQEPPLQFIGISKSVKPVKPIRPVEIPGVIPATKTVEEPGTIPPIALASTTQRRFQPLQSGQAFSPEETLPRVLETPRPEAIPAQQTVRRPLQRVEEVATLPPQDAPHHEPNYSTSASVHGTDTPRGYPGVGRPAGGYPGVGRPAVGYPAVGRPAVGRPAVGYPAVGYPAVGYPTVGRPAVGRPGGAGTGTGDRFHLTFKLMCAILILLLLIGTGAAFAWSNLHAQHATTKPLATLPASAIVSITPAHNNVSTTYTISAVTGKPNATLNQVQARFLSSVSPTQSKAVAATGNGTIPATHAHGSLTFWNDSTSSKTFPAGMAFTDANGIQVVNDVGGTLPPGNPTTPQWTAVTVAAHVQQGGTVGNIKVYDINNWSSYGNGYFVVQNAAAFSGGQNAQAYSFIQSSDVSNVTSATNTLKSSLLANTQAAVTAQVGTNETLLNAVQCVPTVTYNHKTGDHATSITASVVVICRGEVYNQLAAKDMATRLLQRKVATAPSTSYTLTNTITTTVAHAQLSDAQGTIALLIKAESVGMFQFSDAQKQELSTLILGKSEQEAQSILLNQTGISQVVIRLAGGNGHTLPTDLRHITLNVLN